MARTTAAPNEQADWLAAIGEPTRLALIRALAVGAQTVTNLAREVRTEIVNVSHHLSLLKEVGLVTVERDGRFMIYSLSGATVAKGMLELAHASGAKVVIPLE